MHPSPQTQFANLRATLAAMALLSLGSAALHAQVDLGSFGGSKCHFYTQTSSAAPTTNTTNGFTFYSNLSNGSSGSILTSSALTTPAGGVGTVGYTQNSQLNGVQFQAFYNTQTALDAAFPNGANGATGTAAYELTINTSTPNTYAETFTFGPDNYPSAIPQVTNGTWNNGNLVITDPSVDVTITFPAFVGTNESGNGIGININNSSGFAYSQITTADGTHNSFTIPGGTLANNSYFNGSLQYTNNSADGRTSFQSQVNFNIQVGTPPDVSNFEVQKQENYDQANSAAPTVDPSSPFVFSTNVNTNSGPSTLLSSSTVTAPGGSPIFYNSGTNGLYYQQKFNSKAAFDTTYPPGTYNFAINTTTPNAYAASLTLGADNYPPVPQIIGLTNATWSGGAILVTDITQPVTITWNTFTNANGSINIGGNNLNINQGQFTADGTHTSYTFPAGNFSSNTMYQCYLDFATNTGTGTTTIPNASSGSGYQTQVQFLIQTGSGSNTSSSTNVPLIYKENVLLQTSNAAPVEAPLNASEDHETSPPFAIVAQNSVAGFVTGPGAGNPYALGYDAGTDGDRYRYQQGAFTARTGAGSLDATYPDGAYTFKDNQGNTLASLSLTGDVYPNVPQVLTVNGLTPTWNSQGQLVLDPSIDNIIAWSAFTTTNANFTPLSGGHISAELDSVNSNDSLTIDLQSGALKAKGDVSGLFTTMLVPANSLTTGNTYSCDIQYFLASSANFTNGVATSAAGYVTDDYFIAVASAPATQSSVYLATKYHIVEQTGNTTPLDAPLGSTPVTPPAPYSFRAQGPAAGTESGPAPGGSNALVLDVNNNNYRFTSSSQASQGALNAAYPDGTYTVSDGGNVALTGDVYPNTAQLTAVNGATPVWNSSGQLVIDPTIQNTLTWTAFSTTNPSFTFATGGDEHFKLLGNQDGDTFDQRAGVTRTSTAAFNTATIPPNSLTAGNTYAVAIDYYLASAQNTVSAGVYESTGYETDNYFTIAPQDSNPTANSVTKVVSYQQTTTGVPVQVTNPYTFSAFGTTSGSVTGVAGSGVAGPYALVAGAYTGFEYNGAAIASLTNLNTAYHDGTYTFPDGTAVSLTGDAFPTAPQITQVNGATPSWNGNGQLVLNPNIANTITWTAYPGSFASGEELATLSTSSPLFVAPVEAFGPGNGTLPTSAYNTMTIPAGAITAGSTYTGTIQYYADSSVVHTGAGSYDTARYETATSFTVLASTEYSAEKEHVLQQTSNSAPVDYTGPSYDPGPYNFHTFGAAGSTVGPSGTYPLTFSSNDNAFEFFSTGFTSLAALNTNFADGSYTLSNGVAVPLTGDIFPNIVQLTAVNGSPPIWNGSGQLVLNPSIDNTFTWTPFTASNGSFNYSTGGIEHIQISGNQDSVNINDQGAGPEGTPAFNTMTIPANTLTTGNTYTASFNYQLAAGGTFGTTPSLSVYVTDTFITILGSGTTAQTLTGAGSSNLPNQVVGNAPFLLEVSGTSGLPTAYTVTGPATLSGAGNNILTVTGPGTVTITASVPGDSTYAPASTTHTFTVAAAPPVQQINAVTILHSFGDGSVANDGQQPDAGAIQASNGFFYGTTSSGGANGAGVVYAVTPQGQTAILHNFGDPQVTNDGQQPFVGLIQGRDGNFYGATSAGGVGSNGTVFQISARGQYNILHFFGNGTVTADGSSPNGVIQGSDGKFYGTTFGGGLNGAGVIYSVTLGGQVTILHSFGTIANDGLNPQTSLVQGSDGNFYGTTPNGGSTSTGPFTGSGTVFRMTPAGSVTILHSFGDGSVAHDGALPNGPLVQGADGNFYGTTNQGGTASQGTIFKITPSGTVTIIHNFGDGSVPNDGPGPASYLTRGFDGNFYGLGSGGIATVGYVFRITPQGQETILHNFGDGSVINDGFAPIGLVEGSDGNFYVTTGAGGSVGVGTLLKLTLGFPEITSPGTAAGTVSLPFSYQITTSTQTITYAAANLPPGLSINPQTGLISGTPSTPGTTTTTLTLTGATGTNTAQVTFTIVPLPVPSVSSILYAFGSVNTNFTYTATATNNATSFSATGLTGTGLSMSAAGVITGKPTAVGTFPVAITATNATGTGAASTLTIRIFATAPTLSQEYVILHRFNDGSVTNTGANIDGGTVAVDGQNPTSIFQAFDGTYYGMSNHGGTFSDGAIFNMNVQGSTSIVANFSTSGTQSPVPVVPQGFIQGADGNFYLTTEFGGDSTASGNFVEVINPVNGVNYVRHNFGDGTILNDGLDPLGEPVQGSDGYFYGVTLNGGTANQGAIYKVNALGVATLLHSFGDNSVANDGAHPVSGLIQSRVDGNFYGTTPGGGANGQGTIYKITPQGTFNVLYSFGSIANDGTYPAAQLVQGADGKFYGTTQYGGTSGTGTVFKFDSSGENILHNFNDGSVAGDGSNPSAAMIQGVDGNFYGTTQNGGAAFLGTVFEITPSGTVTIIHNFSDGTVPNDGANPAGSLYQDTSGNFFGTTLNGGTGTSAGTVFVIVATQTTTHVPVFTGAAYAAGAIGSPLSFTPKVDFGVLATADGATSSAVQPAVVGNSPNAIVKNTSATSWTISGTENPLLPNFLAFNTTTGAITGVPLTAGTYTVIITPRNSVGAGDPETVTLYIDVPPVINSPTVAGGSVGSFFSYQTTATAAPSNFGAIGLPSWLSVDPATGIISGTPPGGGTYTFSPTATNYAGTGSQQVVLTVTGGLPNTPSFTSLNSASGTAGTPFTFPLAATKSPTSFSALLLPTGLTFDPTSGNISGTPTTAGIYSVPISATNGNGTTGGELTITIAAAGIPAIANPLTASCTLDASFTYQIPATGLIGIYNAVNLPRGLAVNVVSGIISGAPTVTGTIPITLTAANATGTASAMLNLSVSAQPVSTDTWLSNYPTLTGGLSGAPLNDKVPNLLKYLFHVNPIAPMTPADFAALPMVAKDTTTTPGTTYMTITYRKWASATGVNIGFESSTDMVNWTPATPDMTQQTGNDPVTGDPIMVNYFSATGLSKRFVRLSVPVP